MFREQLLGHTIIQFKSLQLLSLDGVIERCPGRKHILLIFLTLDRHQRVKTFLLYIFWHQHGILRLVCQLVLLFDLPAFIESVL